MDGAVGDVPSGGADDDSVSAGLRSLEAHVLDQWRAAMQTADGAGIARCVTLGNAIRQVERSWQTEVGSGWFAPLGYVDPTAL